MPFELGALKLLARGGQADIYEIDQSRVLRVLRSKAPDDIQMLRNEYAVMAELYDRGVSVPKVYELTEADGFPALSMERITGPSMMEQMMKNILGMGSIAKELARLHCETLASRAVVGLMDIKARANYLIDHSSLIDDEDRAFVRRMLQELPAGEALLHGDFHPGNILVSNGKSVIIDWAGATKGDPVSDVAHSYLLLADKPRIPGESNIKHRILRIAAKRFAGMYLADIRAQLGLNMSDFGKWMVVRAAERTVFGHPSELASKAHFVKTCRLLHEKGTAADKWYQAL